MSAAAPPRDPFRAPLGQAIRAQTRRPPPPSPPAAAGLGAPAVRLACVLLAGGLALHEWLGMIAGPPRGALLGVLAVVALLGAGLLAASRVRWRVRRGALVVLALGAAAAALLGLAGVPGADLDPRGWSALATGIGDGIAALPGVTVPYEGNAEWVRIVLAAGGMLLLALAVAAAVWPRRPVPGSRLVAVAGLAVLYAVPAVELNLDHPWRAGALFTVALVAVLHAERLSLERAPLAIGALGVVVVAGLALSPKLDGAKPVIDVQELATQLQSHDEISFTWDHRYGPLDWPRTGRELLRVRARRQAYWKAESLEDFDGVHWKAGPGADRLQFRRPEWIQRISVTVSDLRTRQFIGSGSTQKIIGAPEDYIPASAGSFISTGRSLENGDAYEADVYYPTPGASELRGAGTEYIDVSRDLLLKVPVTGFGDADVLFPPWGSAGVPQGRASTRIFAPTGKQILRDGPYAGVYALAQRLRAGARTPYDYAEAVQRYLLGNRFSYDESPPQRTNPLASFLLDDHRGYCQQFSGAMAMLLRMGGVPARVAAGFSPGVLDQDRGEYIVRDVDAHSWVEVFFPRIGWVTFDPTPAVAPARSQLVGDAPGARDPAGDRPLPQGEDAKTPPSEDNRRARAAAAPWWRRPWLLVPAVILVLAACVLGVALRRERRRHPPTAPELAELERALRRAGRDPRPPTTLRDLERILGPDPEATGYLRAVRDARYGESAGGPTREQRRALRRALGDGLGTVGRARALWALPPAASRWRRSLH